MATDHQIILVRLTFHPRHSQSLVTTALEFIMIFQVYIDIMLTSLICIYTVIAVTRIACGKFKFILGSYFHVRKSGSHYKTSRNSKISRNGFFSTNHSTLQNNSRTIAIKNIYFDRDFDRELFYKEQER